MPLKVFKITKRSFKNNYWSFTPWEKKEEKGKLSELNSHVTSNMELMLYKDDKPRKKGKELG